MVVRTCLLLAPLLLLILVSSSVRACHPEVELRLDSEKYKFKNDPKNKRRKRSPPDGFRAMKGAIEVSSIPGPGSSVDAVAEKGPKLQMCSKDRDCPPFHWCSDESTCRTNLPHHLESKTPCGKEKRGRLGPDHRICKRDDEKKSYGEVTEAFSAAKCFRLPSIEAEYACANGFLMPCRQNKDCPENFRCKVKLFGGGVGGSSAQVCAPRHQKLKERMEEEGEEGVFGPRECRNNFDCAYDREKGRWDTCTWEGRCKGRRRLRRGRKKRKRGNR